MANILMVRAATISNGDTNLRTRLQGQGHTVTDISSATDPASHLPGKNLVLVMQSGDVLDAGFIGQYRTAAVPLINARSQLTYDLRLGTLAAYSSNSQTAVDIGAVGHPLAAGKSGVVTAYTTGQFPSVLNTTEIPAAAAKVVNRNASTALWHVWEFTSGAAMADAFAAPAYRASWQLLTSQANSAWTVDLFDLFDAQVTRALASVGTPLPTPVPTVTLTHPTTSGGTDGSVVVSWPAVTGAATYDVEFAAGLNQTSGFTLLQAGNTTRTYTHANLAAGDRTYGVTAKP